jgi:hypothetical protein
MSAPDEAPRPDTDPAAAEAEAEAEDTLAEIDDDPEDGGDDGEELGDRGDEPQAYTGLCTGGPWNGRHITVRFPRGFLLIDMPGRRCWIYERGSDGFTCRSDEPQPLHDDGPDNRWRAAEEPDWDIRAYDPDNPSGDDDPDESGDADDGEGDDA